MVLKNVAKPYCIKINIPIVDLVRISYLISPSYAKNERKRCTACSSRGMTRRIESEQNKKKMTMKVDRIGSRRLVAKKPVPGRGGVKACVIQEPKGNREERYFIW